MSKRNLNMAFLFALSTSLWLSCAVSSVPQTVQTVEDYSYTDDPAKYRPEIESSNASTSSSESEVIENEAIIGVYNIDEELEAIVDSMYTRNDTIGVYDGYTILVYSGNDRTEAGKVRNRLFDMVPEQEAKFTYKLPTYFVKVGMYFQQLEAAPLLEMIQETYPSAAIVPEKFPIIKDESGEN